MRQLKESERAFQYNGDSERGQKGEEEGKEYAGCMRIKKGFVNPLPTYTLKLRWST